MCVCVHARACVEVFTHIHQSATAAVTVTRPQPTTLQVHRLSFVTLSLSHRALPSPPQVDRLNFFAFWKYKYLLSIDGTVAAYRVPALLAVMPCYLFEYCSAPLF